MPQDATCPKCTHLFPVTESRQAFTVACPKCDTDLTIEFKKPATPPEAGQPPYDLLVKSGTLPGTDASPARSRKKDDEDGEPKRNSGSMMIVILSGVLGLVFVIGGLSLTGWFLFTQIDMTETASTSSNNTRGNPVNRNNPNPPVLPNQPRPKGPPGDPGWPPIEGPGIPPPKQPKPVTKLELPALPSPLEIKAAPVTKETTYQLPEPVRSLRVGGGGRFLILHLPKARKLGVFDANEAKIVRYIPTAEDDVQFAAGMTKLVTYLPGSQVIQRYDLLTGTRELSTKLDLPAGKVEAFCMGHASAGPLLVSVANKGGLMLDIDKFKEISFPNPDGMVVYGGNSPPRLESGYYWAGATGRVFGHTSNYGQPNGVKTLVLSESGVQRYGEHQGTWFVMPGPDDKHVYPGGHGIVSERVRPVPNVPFSMGPGSGYASHLYLPAHHGPFYLHASTIDGFGRDGTPPIGTVSLYMLGSKEPIATYSNTAVCKYGWEGLRGLGIEHSLHLIPQAKLMVIVPESRDELRLYPADLDAALDKTGRDYLIVNSTPPTQFEKGKVFNYQVETKARKGPVTYRLESGPKGMTVNGTGLVRWAVPGNFNEGRADVILLVKDATGQEVFHSFSLTPAGK